MFFTLVWRAHSDAPRRGLDLFCCFLLLAVPGHVASNRADGPEFRVGLYDLRLRVKGFLNPGRLYGKTDAGFLWALTRRTLVGFREILMPPPPPIVLRCPSIVRSRVLELEQQLEHTTL